MTLSQESSKRILHPTPACIDESLARGLRPHVIAEHEFTYDALVVNVRSRRELSTLDQAVLERELCRQSLIGYTEFFVHALKT